MTLLRCAAILLIWTTAATAQAPPEKKSPGPLTADRPTVSASGSLVPLGFMQVEVGITHFQDESNGVEIGRTESLVTSARFGWLEFLEVQVNYLGTVDVTIEEEIEGLGVTRGDFNGSSDIDLGSKWRLFAGESWKGAAVVGLTLPTGETGFGTEGFDPRATLALSGGLSDRLGVDLNLGVDFNTIPTLSGDLTLVDAVQSVALGYTFNDHVSATTEFASFVNLNESERPANIAQVVLGVRFRDGFQMDASLGWGTNDTAVDWFGGVGAVFRLPE